MANQLKITWVKSDIKTQDAHRRTIRALGLHRLHETVVKEDTPPVRGMIHQVGYMVQVEEVKG